MADRVVNNAFAHWSRLHRSGKQPTKIADFSCGPGAFLNSLALIDVQGAKVHAFDVDPESCAIARLLVAALGRSWDVTCCDSLLDGSPKKGLFDSPNEFGPFDIVVGNPPYVRSPLLPAQYAKELRCRYDTIGKGNFDLSVAFIEHALHNLNDGGIASYIVSNKFMTTSYGKSICNKLATNARLIHIEDFQDYQVFEGYTTYTCILTFAKLDPVKRFSVTRFPKGVSGDRDPGPGESSTLPCSRLVGHPWDFATDRAHRILRKLRDPSFPFVEQVCGKVMQGLRTGCNGVFVLEQDTADEVEKEIQSPFVTGEHIRRCRIDNEKLSLLFPYEVNEFNEVKLIPETKLKGQYPLAYAYLKSHRSKLDERSRSDEQPWYAFSRSQNLELCNIRKLLIREMMPRAEFAADLDGTVTFASGYAFDSRHLSRSDLKSWTAILNTPTMEFSLRHTGTQLQSGWFRLMKHHLCRLRLPVVSATCRRLAEQVFENSSDSKLLEKLDDEVARSFGITKSDQGFISSFLADCHARSISRVSEGESSSMVDADRSPGSPFFEPVNIQKFERLHCDRPDLRAAVTFSPNKKSSVHRWYKYTQGYSAELVETLMSELKLQSAEAVLDPFSGCGTTNVVCSKAGNPSIGVEVSPLMCWVASVKCKKWNLKTIKSAIENLRLPPPRQCTTNGLEDCVFSSYLGKAFSPQILAQLWTFMILMKQMPKKQKDFFCLAVLSIMEDVSQIRKHGSHYRYMLNSSSVGLQKLNTQIINPDADIRELVKERLNDMCHDLAEHWNKHLNAQTTIIEGDARDLDLENCSIDGVITSPPYLNRNNYIAQQKAELAMMSMAITKSEYRDLVQRTFRSHVEARFDSGGAVSKIPEVSKILDCIARTEINNAKIPHMIAGYFDDMNLVLRELYRVVRPGGNVAFVVGNSRWGGVVVPVDHILLRLAERTGFVAKKILVTRLKGNSPQQMRKYGRIPVRESIVVFRKKGK